MKRTIFYMLMCFSATVAMFAAGCGGGGGGAPAPVAGPGKGLVRMTVSFQNTPAHKSFMSILAGRARLAEAATSTITVEIAVSGFYSGDGSEFTPVTTTLEIDPVKGYGKATLAEVPIGLNHLLVASATWPSGKKETLKCIIEEVSEGTTTTATANQDTTVVAEAAIAYAASNNTTLDKVPAATIERFETAVAEQHSMGIGYSDMDASQISGYAEVASVTVSPASATLEVGATQQFTAVIYDSKGMAITGISPYWSVDGASGTISTAGVFTGTSEGAMSVKASAGGVADTASVAVGCSPECTADADCDDGDPATADTCSNVGTCSAFCINAACTIACTSDPGCDDSDPLTTDTCTNPGTCDAACSNVTCTPACSIDIDCDDTDSLTLDTCEGAGTCDALCTNTIIECAVDADCDDADATTTDTCTNGGTINAACSYTASSDECAVDMDCDDGDPNTRDVCAWSSAGDRVCANMLISSAISAGYYHTCEAMVDGTVQCWGRNTYGEIGTATDTQLTTFYIAVNSLSGADQVSVGESFSCALISDGTVKCWGDNSTGQLGVSSPASSHTPVTVTNLSGATLISAGRNFACALVSDGSVSCWGYGGNGQLGNGSATTVYSAGAVTGITTAVAVDCGEYHACALLQDGTVSCWGYNAYGQVSDAAGTNALSPVAVSSLTGATAISMGGEHSCAVLSDGSVSCWGRNQFGQLGDGTNTNSPVPVAVTGLYSSVNMLSAGEYHTCVNTVDDQGYCWGYNGRGQLGDGTTTSSSAPVYAEEMFTGITALSAGYDYNCSIYDGYQQCWGYYDYGKRGDGYSSIYPVPTSIPPLESSDISIGEYHMCAITTSAVYCMGKNTYGQLGDGTTTSSIEPEWTQVSGLTSATKITAGYYHTCALTPGGSVECWGRNGYGQLGDGTTTAAYSPVMVSGIPYEASDVSAGLDYTCAALTDGTAWCWGLNSYGQLGNATNTASSIPVQASGITGAVDVEVSQTHSCSLISDGSVMCWGSNVFGELGNGTNTDSNTPVQVSGITAAQAVTLGGNSSCALLADSTVKCWGFNNAGQLGNGTTVNSNVPVTVSGLSGAVTIEAGALHVCAALSDGTVKCWGGNPYYSLGNGTTTASSVAVSPATIYSQIDMLAAGEFLTCAYSSSSVSMECWGYDQLYKWEIDNTGDLIIWYIPRQVYLEPEGYPVSFSCNITLCKKHTRFNSDCKIGYIQFTGILIDNNDNRRSAC